MARGVRLYLVGSFVLVSLAGCGRGFFQTAEREPWRREAEMACLKSGEIHENVNLVRVDPINGPGVCGAEFPLRVGAFDSGSANGLGYVDDLRPPGGIPLAQQPRWPIAPSQPAPPAPYSAEPAQSGYAPQPAAVAAPQGYDARYAAPPHGPISLMPPGVQPAEDDEGEALAEPGVQQGNPGWRRDQAVPPSQPPLPRLGPAPGAPVAAIGPVAVRPVATLACPIVSALDHWIAEAVQPAALRWFGSPVIEIRQISAYSCRGMNGNPNAHISEHAFGNALDVAAFTLADGRRITVRDGWHGVAEEQGFLRDVEGAACQRFNTVLAPGSNAYHYDHIHVDLMRRASGRVICEPGAIPGEVVAARVSSRNAARTAYAPGVTGSIGGRHGHAPAIKASGEDDDDE